jgi:septal ring factor EnvC (AmiA/AmiB activator)
MKSNVNIMVKQKMYTSSIFDTHQIIKSFINAGIEEVQAEAIVMAIAQSKDYDLSKLATKEQLEFVKQQVANLEKYIEKNMTTKEELAKLETRLETKIASIESNILKWVITTMIALTSVVFAIVKFTH